MSRGRRVWGVGRQQAGTGGERLGVATSWGRWVVVGLRNQHGQEGGGWDPATCSTASSSECFGNGSSSYRNSSCNTDDLAIPLTNGMAVGWHVLQCVELWLCCTVPSMLFRLAALTCCSRCLWILAALVKCWFMLYLGFAFLLTDLVLKAKYEYE